MNAWQRLRSGLCILIVGCVGMGPARAAVINAASVFRADVGAAVSSAQDGDTVIVPRGTANWATLLVIDRAITLQGAGPGQTIILDSISGGDRIISINAVAGKSTRLSGFEFGPGTRSSQGYSGSVEVNGNNTDGGTVRVDHCKFDRLNNFSVVVDGAIGVVDHSEFAFNASRIGIYVYHKNWNGNSYGDGSWASPTDWNGSKWWVVEDCLFNNTSSHYAIIDSLKGARWIFRYNTVTNGWCEAHGTESGQRYRGTRAIQVYANRFVTTRNGWGLVNLRSGTATICSNTAFGYANSSAGTLACYRSIQSFVPWGGADGTAVWDKNVPGGPFATGTHTGPPGSGSLIDSTKSWASGQWVGNGYVLKNVTAGRHSTIKGNTSTGITYDSAGGYTTDMAFDTGDSYEIWRVDEALDQAGVGQGDLISGDDPAPVQWPHQQAEPVYAWANTVNGSPVNVGAQFSFIRPTEHFFNNTPRPGWMPLPYPHPLVSAMTNKPTAPQNVRVVSDP